MKILALDQASHTSGYAIFEDNQLIECSHFTFNDSDMGKRLMKIRQKVADLIKTHNIEYVIMEDIQMDNARTNNVQTFKILAEVFGVIAELLEELNIPNSAVLAVSWRSGLGIKGKLRPEQKKNAQIYIENKYGIKPTEDEADAACIGTYYTLKDKASEGFDWS